MKAVVCSEVLCHDGVKLAFDVAEVDSTEITTLDDNEHVMFSIEVRRTIFEDVVRNGVAMSSVVFFRKDYKTHQRRWCVVGCDEAIGRRMLEEAASREHRS